MKMKKKTIEGQKKKTKQIFTVIIFTLPRTHAIHAVLTSNAVNSSRTLHSECLTANEQRQWCEENENDEKEEKRNE